MFSIFVARTSQTTIRRIITPILGFRILSSESARCETLAGRSSPRFSIQAIQIDSAEESLPFLDLTGRAIS
jgi:hypothetical protein